MTIIDLKGQSITTRQVMELKDFMDELFKIDFNLSYNFVDGEEVIKLRCN